MRHWQTLFCSSSKKNSKRNLIGLSIALAMMVGRAPAKAQATLYTNKADFLAASTNLTTLAFDSLVAQNGILAAQSVSLDGVNFVNNGGNSLFVVGPDYVPPYQGWSGNPTILQGPPGVAGYQGSYFFKAGAIDITLPANTTAIGTGLYALHIETALPAVSPVSFTLSTGQNFVVSTFAKPDLAFAGFISSTPITSMEVMTTDTSVPNLSGFTIGQSASVPEASTFMTAGLILTACALLLHRRAHADNTTKRAA